MVLAGAVRSQSTLFLDDPELKIIQDLGPPGRSKVITDGVIATMKALEVAATQIVQAFALN
jgi:hypothetical protein